MLGREHSLEQTEELGSVVEGVGGWRLVGLDEGEQGTRKFRHSKTLREEVVVVVAAVEEEVIETSSF